MLQIHTGRNEEHIVYVQSEGNSFEPTTENTNY